MTSLLELGFSLPKEHPVRKPSVYWCIKCEKWHDANSKLGERHISYVPIMGGIYVDKS